MKKRTLISCFLVFMAVLILSGCGDKKKVKEDTSQKEELADKEGAEEDEEKKSEEQTAEESKTEEAEVISEKVGILLSSDEEDEYWTSQLEIMRLKLEEQGFIAEAVFADDNVKKQQQQIKEMAETEVKAMIIIPQDAYALKDTLEEIEEKEIPVFSYDQLIMDTELIKYHTAFNTREMGQMVGQQIIKDKELEKAMENGRKYTIEFFMGDVSDSRELFFFNGIMEALKPYFEEGILVCRSGELSFEDTAVENADQMKEEFADILEKYYKFDKRPDIICLGTDAYIDNAIEVLKREIKSTSESRWPYITGCGCELDTLKKIQNGVVAFSVFKDERTLASKCVELVSKYLKDEEFKAEDYHQYDNGVKIIGTNFGDVQIIDKDNYQLLIDNGYYSFFQDSIK